MSKIAKKLQKRELVRRNRIAVEKIAHKSNCYYDSYDDNSYRLSFKDELGVYRIDIYLSTMTVGLIPIMNEDNSKWFKRKTLGFVEEIMSNPVKFEINP